MRKKFILIFLTNCIISVFPLASAFAYVDPGSGFVFLQGGSFLWGIILALFAGGMIFFKFFFRFIKKFFFILAGLLLILASVILIRGLIMDRGAKDKKVIILGIDGMDANLTKKLMQEGKLPNFSRLQDSGTFSSLYSSNPSESAVAWTSFMTGSNPGSHGIFDFIMRNPENYFPYLTLSQIKGSINPQITSYRKAKAFWQDLSARKINCSIFFCPNTFPPEKINGKMISGMGVPDIGGTMGKFLFYTSKPLTEADKDSRGKIISVSNQDKIETFLYGPKIKTKDALSESKIQLKIIKISNDKISLQFQDKEIILNKNQWSPWQRLSFKIGLFRKAKGITRFYLKNIEPDLELYCSPINFDPLEPLFPISYPKNYSSQMAKKTGLFYTQGMPYDTWALSEGRIDEKTFLELADEILNENKRILDQGLKEFKSGVFFYYFETLDPIQHMFWRYIDPESFLYEANSIYKETIVKYYQKMDEVLGNLLKRIDKDTTLIVMSDHGFGPFRRAVHLNRWLLENNYLVLNEDKQEGEEFFEDIDWSKTKAYALGFGGIYINLAGRERLGIVNEEEQAGLKTEIRHKLKGWLDPLSKENVVKEVYDADIIFNGPYKDDAPDLFVGFNSGWRASWQTALGAVPKILIEDNKKKWSGDHLVSPDLVPGVIFINKKIKLEKPNIIDVSGLITGVFNDR